MLLALAQRLDSAAWTDVDQITAGLQQAAEALERLSHVFAKRRRRPKKRGGPAPERNPAFGSNIEAGVEAPPEPAEAEVSAESAADGEAGSSDDPSDDSIPDA